MIGLITLSWAWPGLTAIAQPASAASASRPTASQPAIPEALPGSPRRIVLDGLFDDWADLPPAFVDPAGDQGRAPIDVRKVWLAHDERFVYLRFETGRLLNLQKADAPVRVHFDLDRSAGTGTPVGAMGSDLAILLPERHIALQTADNFEAAIIPHSQAGLTWEPTLAGECFELRIARDLTDPRTGKPLRIGDAFDLLITARPASGDVEEWAPDAGRPYPCELLTGALQEWPAIDLSRSPEADLRLVSYNMLWGGLAKRPEPFNRILRALQPDVIGFQEAGQSFSEPGGRNEDWADLTRRRLTEILPLPAGESWHVHREGATLLASRWPLRRIEPKASFATGVGQAMALIDLPDERGPRDLYVMSCHYKCCGELNSSEDRKRQENSDGNVAWLRELRNQHGPHTLPPGTPIVICGDLNLVGGPRILQTLITGDIVNEQRHGPDSPPDWDGSPLADLRPRHNAHPAAYTWRDDQAPFPPGRLDVIVFTDSVLEPVKSFVLNTLETPAELLHHHDLRPADTAQASDHLPLVVDFRLRGE